jgi:hypothetical protein
MPYYASLVIMLAKNYLISFEKHWLCAPLTEICADVPCFMKALSHIFTCVLPVMCDEDFGVRPEGGREVEIYMH